MGGSNNLVLEEAERSLHDALCVVRSLVKERSLIVGGGAGEMQLCVELAKFAEALEVIPYTLAENAGLNPIKIVTKLRKAHANGNKDHGIDIKKGDASNMWEADVIQPLLVNISAINLATEFVRMILKVDDIIQTR